MNNWQRLHDLKLSDLDLDQEDRKILQSLAGKLQNNYPYDKCEYAGQMIKPAHPLAQAAVWMTSLVNPNNHALDGGKATSALELEVIESFAKMIGFTSHLGHLTSGGTIANLEALWVARQSNPSTVVLANELAHYTHSRMSEVLGIPFEALPADAEGKICMKQLIPILERYRNDGIRPTLVVTMGTTGMGRIDPLDEIIALKNTYNFRIHADAAYGGYFKLTTLSANASKAFEALHLADSVVIDPHKHGLQPYGCGAVIFNDPEVGRFYKHDSPYTYFTSSELHLGEITLECSRAGATAAGVWATLKKFPLQREGEFSKRLTKSLYAALGLHQAALQRGLWSISPELDICIFSKPGSKASQISALNRAFFEKKANQGIHLALFKLQPEQCPWELEWDTPTLVVVRSVLMKPEHDDPIFWEAVLD